MKSTCDNRQEVSRLHNRHGALRFSPPLTDCCCRPQALAYQFMPMSTAAVATPTADAAANGSAVAATQATSTTQATQTGAVADAGKATATTTTPVEIKLAKVEGVPESEVTRVTALAKEMGWDQATADKYYASATKAHLADVTAIKNEIAQAQAKFEADNKAHPVYGGAKYEESNARIQQVLAFAGEEGKALASFLESQDNAIVVPQVRNFLAKLGYALGDGKIVTPGPQTPTQAPLADRMFGAAK